MKGKRFKEDDVSLVAGDGRFGFKSHRQEEVVLMSPTVDGTGWKKSRKSVCKPRKEVCKLVSSDILHSLTENPDVRNQRNEEARKKKRARNRNNGARRGWRRKKSALLRIFGPLSKARLTQLVNLPKGELCKLIHQQLLSSKSGSHCGPFSCA